MTGDLDLFGNDASEGADKPDQSQALTPVPAAKWQIELLRKALDTRGLTSLHDRQQAIENAVGRKVESLQTLTDDEALSALKQFAETTPTTRKGSAWDERAADTWIDKL